MKTILTQAQNDVLGDLAIELLRKLGPPEDRTKLIVIVDAFRMAVEPQIIEIRKLREIAKHAGAHARGDEDGAKLYELLDATRDPELMFTR
jgi:hypothetical protein